MSQAAEGTKTGPRALTWESEPRRVGSDAPFFIAMVVLGGVYVVLILAMLLADILFTSPGDLLNALKSEEIRFSIRLSLISCTLTTILSLWAAIPIGYLMSRFSFRGKALLDALLDVPIVLPPLVIGLSLLVLFHLPIWEVGRTVDASGAEVTQYRRLNDLIPLSYTRGAVVLSQFMVACAFAVRTMRATFDQINPRREQVALTLGCTRGQAFWRVVLPEAWRGVLTAATLAWARAMGEFGPILIFAGATRMKTEVLPTTVFLEMSVGNIEAALAVSMLMVGAAVAVLVLVRVWGRGIELPAARGM